MRTVRIAFCWTGLTGYMPACWKALAALSGVEIRVFVEKRRNTSQHAFSSASLSGLAFRVRDREDGGGHGEWLRELEEFRPDLIEVTGWHGRFPRAVARARRLATVPKVLGLDLQYNKTLKQRLAPFLLRSYLRRFKAVVVPGERAALYARHLGFDDGKIEQCLYGFDGARFRAAKVARERGSWPRKFVFVGRYCADKGVECLLSAYRAYRRSVSSPWGLTCCGMGELAGLIRSEAGVTDLGFVEPETLPDVLAQQGAFILPSRVEPWGVALGEACATGLPVVATTACGASVELLRPYYNGLAVAKDDVRGLAGAMRWIHERENDLRVMGERSTVRAAPFDAEIWAHQWRELAVKWGRPNDGALASDPERMPTV